MSFFEIEAFLRTAECDASYAAAVLGKSELDICLAIEKLQKSVLTDLFTEPLRPSKNTLTDFGKIYIEYAKSALLNLQNGILAVLNHGTYTDNISKITINLYQTVGKEVLTDSLIELLHQENFKDIQLDIITSNNQHDECQLKFHIMFGHISPNYKKFFKTKWSAVIKQGLYASENYLKDVGSPKAVYDLIDHTVIVCGDSFKDVTESEYNWHLRNDYGLPKFIPSIVVSNQALIYAAVNADLGIGPLFCHQSRHLQRILPWISGPVSILDFAVRIDIPEKIQKYICIFDEILQIKLKSVGIEIMKEAYNYED